MTTLKKLLIILSLSIIALAGTISVYGVGNNPYSDSLDNNTKTSLDSVINLVKKKGLSLGKDKYRNLVSTIDNRLEYLSYGMKEIISSIDGEGGSGTKTVITFKWEQYKLAPSPLPPKPNRTCIEGEVSGIYKCVKTEVNIDTGESGLDRIECTGTSAPILGGSEDRTIIANHTANAGIYNGTYNELKGSGSNNPWPGTPSLTISLSLDKNKYIAAKFTTDSLEYNGRIQLSGTNSFQGPSPKGRTIAISKCPGDFSNKLNQAKCITNSHTLYWSTSMYSDGPKNFFCKLEKNTTYYLNIVDSDNQTKVDNGSMRPEYTNDNNNYSTSDCNTTDGYCGILMTNSYPINFK